MRSTKPAPAFTLPELLISIGIIAVLLFVFVVPAGGPGRAKAQRIKCINNLKNVGLAKRLFLNDNPGSELDGNLTGMTAADYFRSLSNELSTPRILACPNDPRVRIATDFQSLINSNVSYFVSPVAGTNDFAAFFAGDRNLQTNGVPVPSGSMLKLTRGLDAGWTSEIHDQQGDIALNDGSVQQFNSERLLSYLGNGTSTNLLLIP